MEATTLAGSGGPLLESFTTDTLPTIVKAIAINQTGAASLPVALVEVVGAAQFGGLLMIEAGQVVGWLPMVGSLFGATRRASGTIVMLDAAPASPSSRSAARQCTISRNRRPAHRRRTDGSTTT